MNIGSSELLLVLIVALVVFGPSKLPELGRTVGRAVGEFRKAARDFQQTWELEAANAERLGSRTPPEGQEMPVQQQSEGASGASRDATSLGVEPY